MSDDDRTAAIASLEAKVRADPDDANARDVLLCEQTGPHYSNADSRNENILWHVRNRPRERIVRTPFAAIHYVEHLEAFAAVERAWAEQHGPSFLLAKQLAEQGAFDEVATFQRTCSAFWERECVDACCDGLAHGLVPDFPRVD